MNAQVSFLDGTLSLIHIPLDLYSNLLQPILKVLLPTSQDPTLDTANGVAIDSQRHGFLNISVTPIECSIVCNSAWAKSVFEPAIQRLPPHLAKTVAISKDTYAVLSVSGSGLDAGSRVADLTSPLALANIPIFFITTYYSDFILVPTKDREAVVTTLLDKGFVFSEDDQSQLVSANPSPTATSFHPHAFTLAQHSRAPSQSSSHHHHHHHHHHHNNNSIDSTPTQQAPSSVDDLQNRTFNLLHKHRVTPYIDPGLTLVQCTGIRPQPPHHNSNNHPTNNAHSTPWIETIDPKLYLALCAALASRPRFLSLTLAPPATSTTTTSSYGGHHDGGSNSIDDDGDPPSLLLDRRLLGLFGEGALAGPTGVEAGLVPIFLDLKDLPVEAAGIVSGVAGRLVREMGMGTGEGGGGGGGELSYLSTARAGAVILSREQAEVAVGVLRPLLAGGDREGGKDGE